MWLGKVAYKSNAFRNQTLVLIYDRSYITVVSGRLNVVKGLKRTNQIVSFGRSGHMIGL
jgi:hypothetical protein